MNSFGWELFWWNQWQKAKDNLAFCEPEYRDIYSRVCMTAYAQYRMASAQYWAEGVKPQ